MFKEGDIVVYPMHGVGTIVKVEEKEVLNKKQPYYFIKLNESLMTVMIPVSQSEKARLRKLLPNESFYKIKDILQSPPEGIKLDWKTRYTNNQHKVREGSIKVLAEVVRDLYNRNNIKELSRGEKKIYDSAFQLLTDELSYTDNLDKDTVGKEILKLLAMENENQKLSSRVAQRLKSNSQNSTKATT